MTVSNVCKVMLYQQDSLSYREVDVQELRALGFDSAVLDRLLLPIPRFLRLLRLRPLDHHRRQAPL